MRRIYLDYNATTPVAPSVQEAMMPFLTEHFGNPSSNHALGRACHEAVEDAREQVAGLLGAEREEIVFTGGGTEANNLALKGVIQRRSPGEAHLIVSSFEHPSVDEPAKHLHRIGYAVSWLPCTPDGVVEPQAVEDAIRPNTALVSVMHANNEVGSLQPIRQIAEVCRSHDVLVHTDAAQSTGKVRTNVDELGVDLLTIAGHKVYAPKGVGALFVRRGVALEPVIHGAAHEGGLRPGTENTPYIVGLGRAAVLASKALDEAADRLAALRDRLWERISRAIPRATMNGSQAERLPNTLSLNFPNVTGGELLGRTPELCASTGSACHSGVTHMSPTLEAMGLAPQTARGAVRLSVGWYTSEEDIDRAASLLIAAWEGLED
ncbi:MAG: cysteine desulfurase family protein [Pirellulaceae bacterium]|jgi:cysteine desulfurase|nr:cysteine desulfurase family protein [Pirellulaceae bacterium]MDP7015717.1 cysteine desulfurase family protein [Pirellulaceae bacterium]